MADLAPEDLFAAPNAGTIKARTLDIATSSDPPLPVTSWEIGGPSERWSDIFPRAIDAFLSGITTQAVRGFFFDLATDPGDPGDLSADQTPRPGFLSALGQGWYGTTRGEQTYATGFVTLTNTDTHAISFKPTELTFHRSTALADGSYPSYRNSPDPSIYTNLDGSVTIGIGGSLVVPVIAEQIGTVANATGSQISVLVTQTFGQMSVNNANSVLGSARESRDLYIARCKQVAQAASPAGAADAYRRAATTASDGTVLQRYDGTGAVDITRVWVTPSSTDSTVDAYFASPAGAAIAADVTTANANITGTVIGTLTSPTGVVPIGTTYSGAAATETPIGPLAGTAKISAVPGVTTADLLAAAQAAILVHLADTFSTYPIGGLDQSGSPPVGTIYKQDIADDVRDSYAGLRAVSLTTPASDTAIALGHVPVLTVLPSVQSAANNGSGLVRLTLGDDITGKLSTSDIIQATGFRTTTEANNTWTITVIDTTHIDLQGSSFTHASSNDGAISKIIVTVS